MLLAITTDSNIENDLDISLDMETPDSQDSAGDGVGKGVHGISYRRYVDTLFLCSIAPQNKLLHLSKASNTAFPIYPISQIYNAGLPLYLHRNWIFED